MAEYYEESRNEGPNLLGMAGLLGLGALAGAGGYYALRNARGKNAAAEALTRSARSERPRGVQMTNLGARRTGDFGLVDIPPSRSARVTGNRGVTENPRPVAPHAPEQYSNVPPSVPPTTPTNFANRLTSGKDLGFEEEYVPYRPDPKEMVSRKVADARRQAATKNLLQAAENRKGTYQLEIPGTQGTLMALRSPVNALAEETGEFIMQAPSRPLSATPAQGSLFASSLSDQPAIPMATVDLSDFLDDVEVAKQLELKEAERYSATPEAQAEMRRATRNVQNIEGVEKARAQNILLDFRRELENSNLQEQAVDAVESGAAQQTGRTWQQLSRNEDLDKTQIAQLEAQADADYKAMLGSNPSEWSGVEADAAINTVTRMLPDGPPLDQAERVGYDLRTGERFTYGNTPAPRTGLAPGGTIELEAAPGADLSQSSAARFLQQRREKMMVDTGTPGRLETQLAEAFGPEAWREDPKATRRRNALKLGAAGNEQFFENLNEGTVTIAGEQFPVSSLKEGVYMEDTARNLANKIEGYKDWLGNFRLQETRNQIGLATELDNLVARDAALQADVVDLGEQRRSFSSPQERDAYLTASRGREVALDLQDELDARINETLRNYEMSERRLTGAEKATARNIRRAAVPQKLMGGVEEGIVVRPVLTAPDNMVVEEGELSNIERGRPVGNYISQEQLEVVPGGLLSGGRAKSLVNIGGDLGIDPDTGERILLPNVNVDTGETNVQKLAGKRMGADVNVRGRGGVAGLDTRASIGIYGPELAEYGTAAMSKQGEYTEAANRPPTATESALPVHRVRKVEVDEQGDPVTKFFTYPSSYEDPKAYKYTQEPTQQALDAIDMSRAVQGVYAKYPRDVADAMTGVALNELARRANKQLPSSVRTSGPSTPLERTIQERTPEGQFKTYQVSNRPVAPTPEPTVRNLESTQLAFPSNVVPPIVRARTTEADVYATNLANYMTRMQRERAMPTSSPVVIQPNILVTEEYQLPLALSAGQPTPQMQGPVRAPKQLRNFGPPIRYIESYQPSLI
jgi:hypothetical protein